MSSALERRRSVAACPAAGADLRAAGRRVGWSLPAMAGALRIRLPHLEALEEGRIGDLPGNAYALGFLRTYASALGLDPNEIARRFKAEAAAVNQKTELAFPPRCRNAACRPAPWSCSAWCWRSAPMSAGTACPARDGCRPRRRRRYRRTWRRWPSRRCRRASRPRRLRSSRRPRRRPTTPPWRPPRTPSRGRPRHRRCRRFPPVRPRRRR